MKYKVNVLMILAGILLAAPFANADHTIGDLEGYWRSSIFPNDAGYLFRGLRQVGHDKYVVHHSRGACLGSGLIDLHSGKVRTVEVCPPNNGNEDRVFLNEWTITREHGHLRLNGGYWAKGSSQFREENLDKDLHHNEDEDDHDDAPAAGAPIK